MPQKNKTHPLTPRPSPQTSLVRYLDNDENWINPLERGLCPPIEDPTLLSMARNSVRGSKNNNDGLEFVGDRVTNLACDLLIDRANTTDRQCRVVGRVLSNNDTLGRLAYRLRLHEHASFDTAIKVAIAGWSPKDATVPPKEMADLFESHVGALYVEKGWQAVLDWLITLYAPLVPAAQGDFLGRHPGSNDVRLSPPFDGDPTILGFQGQLVDSMTLSALILIKGAQALSEYIPPSTIFTFDKNNRLVNDSDREPVGLDVIDLWVCKICLQISPDILKATNHAAHLMTWITYLIMNDETMSLLACFLGIQSYFEKSDPHYRPSTSITDIKEVEKITSGLLEDEGYRRKLALGLKATVAGFYLHDDEAANTWGEEWFKMMVKNAHDLIATHPRYRLSSPSCHPAGTDTPRKKPRASTGSIRDSPSRERPVPENSTPRKRPRTSLDAMCEGDNTPLWHSATPTVKNPPYSSTLQRSSPAKPIESPSLKRVRTDSGVPSRPTDKRKPNLRSPLATPTSSKIKRKLSFINDKSTPSLNLKPTQNPSTTSNTKLPSNKGADPFV